MIELRDKDGNVLASGKVIEDGQRLKVSMSMMDAAPPNVEAITMAAIVDSRLPHVTSHRPDEAVLSDDDRAARNRALFARDARTANAWKNPPPLQAATADASVSAGATAGDARSRRMERTRTAWRGGK